LVPKLVEIHFWVSGFDFHFLVCFGVFFLRKPNEYFDLGLFCEGFL
jgi:hypothetical protein